MHQHQCQYQWKGGNEEKSVRSVGHLGLLLSDAIYGSLTNNALFLIPVNPGPFVPPPQEPPVHKSTMQKMFGKTSIQPSKSVMQLSKPLLLRLFQSSTLLTKHSHWPLCNQHQRVQNMDDPWGKQ